MGLNAQKAQAVIEIQGKDSISDLIQQVGGKLDGLGAKTAAQKGAIAGVRESWASVATGVHSVLGIVGQVGGAIQSVAGWMKDAAQEQAIGASFERAFKGASALNAELEKATGGQMDDEVYQQIAVQLHQAGLEGAQISQVLNLATKAANATGREVGQVAHSFAEAVTRGNDAAFKSVGINIDLKKTLHDHAKAVGLTTVELGIAERRTLLLKDAAEGVAKAYGDVDIKDSAIAKIQQLQVEWNTFMDAVKTGSLALADSGFWADIGVNFVDLMSPLTPSLAKHRQELEELAWPLRMQLEEQRKINAAIDEHIKQLDAEIAAEEREMDLFNRRHEIRREALLKEADATNAAKWATANHAVEMQNLMNQMGRSAEAAEWSAKIDTALADITGKKVVPSIQEQYAALKETESSAINAAYAMATFAESQGDAALALKKWLEYNRLIDEKKGARAPSRGGGGGSRAKNPGFNDDAESRRQIAAQNQSIDDKNAQAKLQREIDFIFREGEEKLAAQERVWARDETKRKAHEEAKRALEDMLEKESASSFTGAAAALKSSSEIYLQGIGAFADSLHSEMGRITDIMALVEKSGGTMGDAWAKSAPGMVSAIGQVGAAFFKDAKTKYTILSIAEAGASIASFATLDFMGGALHAAAAVQYGLAASMAGGSGASAGARGGGSRGASSAKPGQIGGSTPAQSQPSPTIVLNFGGATIYGGNRESVARELAGDINKNVYRYQSAAKPHQWVP